MRRIAVLAIGLLVLLPVLFGLALSTSPSISLASPVTAIGASTPLSIRVHDPHGVRSVVAFIEQDGVRYKAAEAFEPSRRLRWRRHVADESWELTVGAKTTPQIKDGNARLIVEATSNDFRSSTARVERDVRVDVEPPAPTADSEQH